MEKKELEVVKSKEASSNSNKEEKKHSVKNEAERFDINMRKITEDWAMNSKLHGVSNILRNPGFFLKIFWILCFLVCFGYCKLNYKKKKHKAIK